LASEQVANPVATPKPKFDSTALGVAIALGLILPNVLLANYLALLVQYGFGSLLVLLGVPPIVYLFTGIAFKLWGRTETAVGLAIAGGILSLAWVILLPLLLILFGPGAGF
jgi:hypothetical protein